MAEVICMIIGSIRPNNTVRAILTLLYILRRLCVVPVVVVVAVMDNEHYAHKTTGRDPERKIRLYADDYFSPVLLFFFFPPSSSSNIYILFLIHVTFFLLFEERKNIYASHHSNGAPKFKKRESRINKSRLLRHDPGTKRGVTIIYFFFHSLVLFCSDPLIIICINLGKLLNSLYIMHVLFLFFLTCIKTTGENGISSTAL